ncbi:MAG: PKD domain-containing protein, partial [Flavobacteriales bacterium]
MKSVIITTIAALFLLINRGSGQVDFSSTQVCLGNYTVLNGSSTTPDSLITSWLWDLDNDLQYDDASGKDITYIFPQAGSLPVSLKIIPTIGQPDSVTKQAIVNPLPNVNFHVDNACAFQAALYIDQSTISSGSITQWQWDFDNDNVVDDISGPNVFFTVGPPQTYVSKLTCISDLGCTAFATKTTEIFPQPVVDFMFWGTCVGEGTTFHNNSTPNDSISYYLWNFGDSNYETTFDDPVHIYEAPGAYQVSLIALTDNNCRDTATVNVGINPTPDIVFSYSGDSALLEGQQVTVSVEGSMDAYQWSTGETTGNITISSQGTYHVTVTDANQCTAEDSLDIIVKQDVVSVLNEILTPNSDGVNDYLKIDNLDFYNACEVSVFNRWNEEVFSSA